MILIQKLKTINFLTETTWRHGQEKIVEPKKFNEIYDAFK